LFARFIPDGDLARFAEDLASLLRNAFTDTMGGPTRANDHAEQRDGHDGA
jgi:hypothetical protein